MHHQRLLGLAGLAAMFAVLSGALALSTLHARHPARVLATAVIPPAPVVAEPAPAPMAVAESDPPAAKAADLPTIEVKPRDFHVVPDEAAPAPAVVLETRDGRPIDPTAAPAAVRPPRDAPLGGRAQAADGASLSIDGRPVRLFGVRAPSPRESCAVATGGFAPCSDAARTALAAHLAGNATVSCQMPPGQRGDPAYVCRDSAGIDLGGVLVADGLALADTRSSYDYVGAEHAARSGRRGLWRDR